MSKFVSPPVPARQSARIRAMFGAIAPRYDFLNHVLSLNIDQRWRRETVREIKARLGRRNFDALDVACGTGDLTATLRRASTGRVVGMDFCHPMLVLGLKKRSKGESSRRMSFAEADALQLPLPAECFDAVTIAFGLRNLEDYRGGLQEMLRVLRPGGVLGILEFSRPSIPVFRQVYRFYFERILPRLGRWFSGVEGPYSYLPDSVSSFPPPEDLKTLLQDVGFTAVGYRGLTGGIATLHLGTRPARPVSVLP